MEKISKKSAILTISNILTLAISMIISMVFARYRTLEENGTYAQIMLIINTVMPFVVLGIPNSITYFIGKSDSKSGRDEYIGNFYSLIFSLCIVAGVILYLISPVIAKKYDNELIMSMRYVFLIFPLCLQLTSTISDVLVSCDKDLTLLIYRLSYSFSLLVICVLMVWLKWSFTVYMIIYTVVLIALSIIVVLINKEKLKIRKIFCFDLHFIKKILRFSIPIGVATVVGTLSLEFDKLFISMNFSTEELGIYSYVAKELPIVAVTNSVTSVLLPTITRMISRGNTDNAVELWKNSSIVTFSITAFFACGVFTYAPQVISILYSDRYLAGVTIFRIYALTLFLRFTYFGIFFNTTGNGKKILFYSLFGLFSNIILNVVLFYIFGINGPAIATVVSIYLTDCLQLIGTKKLLKIKISELMPWVSYAKLLVINVLLSVLFYYIKIISTLDVYISENGEAIVLAIIWAGVYFLIIGKKVIYVWKTLNRTEI